MNLVAEAKSIVHSVETFVEAEYEKIVGGDPQIEKDLHEAAQVANNLVNGFKQYVLNPAEKTIEQVITDIVPEKWVAAAKVFLPKLMVDLKWVEENFFSAPAKLLSDGLANGVNATGDVKATNMAVLQAHINTQLTAAAGTPVPIQTSLTQADAVYKGIIPSEDVNV